MTDVILFHLMLFAIVGFTISGLLIWREFNRK